MSDRISGSRAAVLLDGGFVSKRFGAVAARYPEAAYVVAFARRLLGCGRDRQLCGEGEGVGRTQSPPLLTLWNAVAHAEHRGAT